MSPVAGIVLAGGASTRAGVNKMLVAVGGEPLIHRASRAALGAGLSPVIVVTGLEPDREAAAVADLAVTCVPNPDPSTPPGRSLALGLAHLGSESRAAIALLGDMPRTTSDMLRALVRRFERGGVECVMSRYGATVAPPILYGRETFETVRHDPGTPLGNRIAASGRFRVAFVDWPEALKEDLDTPEDLLRIADQSWWSSGAS